MNDAVLYAKSNSFQRVATKKMLDEFLHMLQWQQNGGDSVLDVGCGTGDVTNELILPLLPPTFSRLVGCDKSGEMINYARQHFGHEKLMFDQLDITGNVDEFLTKFGAFDHVVSFFCLHWVRDQQAAMSNIAKLLTPIGDCFLMFIATSNIYTVYDDMSKCSKWSPHMKDVKSFTSPYYDSICSTDDLHVLLRTAGFTIVEIRTRKLQHLYCNEDEFVNFVRSINPFVSRINASEREQFIDEVVTRTVAKNVQANEPKYSNAIDVVIVYARKVSLTTS